MTFKCKRDLNIFRRRLKHETCYIIHFTISSIITSQRKISNWKIQYEQKKL